MDTLLSVLIGTVRRCRVPTIRQFFWWFIDLSALSARQSWYAKQTCIIPLMLGRAQPSTEPRMEGMGTEVFAMAPYASQLPNQVPWRRSFGPVRCMANSKMSSCSLAPSHHGEAGAARPLSAEAFLRAVEFKQPLYMMDRKRASYDPNKSIWVGCGGSMLSVGAVTGAAVGSAGFVFRSRNSLSFLKSSRSGSSMLP